MSSTQSLPGSANLRVEIVPDRQTSFVRKTTVMSVITECDYSRATGFRKPLIPSEAGETRGRVSAARQDAASRRSGFK